MLSRRNDESSNNSDNKKPRHPVGVFRIGWLSLTPVELHIPGA